MKDRSPDGSEQPPKLSPNTSKIHPGLEPDDARDRLGDIDLRLVFADLWQARLIIFAITMTIALAAVLYTLVAQPWYRADVVLAPVEQQSGLTLPSQLGSLASLAGVNFGASGGALAESLATLKSRELAREFIEENSLLGPILEATSSPHMALWKRLTERSEADIRDAITLLHETVLTVDHDRQTNLVTLSVTWIHPDSAADWANDLAVRVNERMRSRALRESEANVEFLRNELAETTVVALQQSIARLLESETQRLMLSRGNEEFAFRIVDPAAPPKHSYRPNKPIIALLGMVFGFLIGVAYTLSRRALSTIQSTKS